MSASPISLDGAVHHDLAISSQVWFFPSGQWWQELLHMLRCLIHLAVWVAEQLTNCPQETKGHMVLTKVPYKTIKPFVLWHRGAPVWTEEDFPWKFTFCSITPASGGLTKCYHTTIKKPIMEIFPRWNLEPLWQFPSFQKLTKSALLQPFKANFPQDIT